MEEHVLWLGESCIIRVSLCVGRVSGHVLFDETDRLAVLNKGFGAYGGTDAPNTMIIPRLHSHLVRHSPFQALSLRYWHSAVKPLQRNRDGTDAVLDAWEVNGQECLKTALEKKRALLAGPSTLRSSLPHFSEEGFYLCELVFWQPLVPFI